MASYGKKGGGKKGGKKSGGYGGGGKNPMHSTATSENTAPRASGRKELRPGMKY